MAFYVKYVTIPTGLNLEVLAVPKGGETGTALMRDTIYDREVDWMDLSDGETFMKSSEFTYVVVAQRTKNGKLKYDWMGTRNRYNQLIMEDDVIESTEGSGSSSSSEEYEDPWAYYKRLIHSDGTVINGYSSAPMKKVNDADTSSNNPADIPRDGLDLVNNDWDASFGFHVDPDFDYESSQWAPYLTVRLKSNYARLDIGAGYNFVWIRTHDNDGSYSSSYIYKIVYLEPSEIRYVRWVHSVEDACVYGYYSTDGKNWTFLDSVTDEFSRTHVWGGSESDGNHWIAPALAWEELDKEYSYYNMINIEYAGIVFYGENMMVHTSLDAFKNKLYDPDGALYGYPSVLPTYTNLYFMRNPQYSIPVQLDAQDWILTIGYKELHATIDLTVSECLTNGSRSGIFHIDAQNLSCWTHSQDANADYDRRQVSIRYPNAIEYVVIRHYATSGLTYAYIHFWHSTALTQISLSDYNLRNYTDVNAMSHLMFNSSIEPDYVTFIYNDDLIYGALSIESLDANAWCYLTEDNEEPVATKIDAAVSATDEYADTRIDPTANDYYDFKQQVLNTRANYRATHDDYEERLAYLEESILQSI